MRKSSINNISTKRYEKENYLHKEIIYTKSPTTNKYWTALSAMFFWPFSSPALTWSGTELHPDYGQHSSQLLQKINLALTKAMTQGNGIFLFYLVYRLRKKSPESEIVLLFLKK